MPECWGFDDDGQASPPEGERFVSIGSSSAYSCGLKDDGSVICWGTEDMAGAYPPNERFVSIDVGSFLVCGIREDRVTVCWGDVYGQPETVEGRYSAFASGGLVCGLLEDVKPMCPGWGFYAELGIVPIPEDERFDHISGGLAHFCALRDDGTPFCWGSDDSGQASPPKDERFTVISSGREHTCALRIDGTPLCWGNNVFGQASPPQGEKFTAISSGGMHTCGLHSDGTADCWGNNLYGQSSPKTRAGPKAEPDHPVAKLLWRAPFPAQEQMHSSPTVAGGMMYITLYDNSLYALSALMPDEETPGDH